MRVEPEGGDRRKFWQRRLPTSPNQASSTTAPVTRAPPILPGAAKAALSSHPATLNPPTASLPEPGHARSRKSRRVVIALAALLLLVVLGLSAALVITNLRIS